MGVAVPQLCRDHTHGHAAHCHQDRSSEGPRVCRASGGTQVNGQPSGLIIIGTSMALQTFPRVACHAAASTARGCDTTSPGGFLARHPTHPSIRGAAQADHPAGMPPAPCSRACAPMQPQRCRWVCQFQPPNQWNVLRKPCAVRSSRPMRRSTASIAMFDKDPLAPDAALGTRSPRGRRWCGA